MLEGCIFSTFNFSLCKLNIIPNEARVECKSFHKIQVVEGFGSGVDAVSFLLGCDAASHPMGTDTGLKMTHFTKKLMRDIKYGVDLIEGHDFYSRNVMV